jgi:hypothetical protein
MSIKKLFGNPVGSRNFLSETTKKTSFDDAESAENVEQKHKDHERYIPQVDYADPVNFAKYGSARLYYESAFTRILDFYPYDGSEAETNKFHNESLDIEKYILENKYPRTNGYITLARNGYTVSTKTDGYGVPVTNEFIDLKGGPGTGSANSLKLKDLLPNPYSSKNDNSNIYDETIYTTAGLPTDYGSGTRTSNLKADFDDGVTVEFWLKTGSMTDNSDRSGDPLSNYQVVFDLWNNENSSSHDYGRLRIELTGTVGDDDSTALKPFVITVESGSVAGSNISRQTIGSTSLHDSFGDWNHYALSMYNTGSNFAIELYVNGDFHEQQLVSSKTIGEFTPQETLGRIGALITTPFGESAPAGAGRLSGSMDEFRYWKTKRTEKQIGRNWISQVRGGSNTDISNTTLGVYYKFNEGITGDSTTDSIVLDYAGRVTNGVWTGYSSESRNVGSAIVSASAATKEFLDPIIRSNHPDVMDLKAELITSGTSHDYNNNAALISLVPGWIQDEEAENENSDLRYMAHIMGAYFDKLYLQISEIPKLRHLNYVSASHKPFPFAHHLPQSLGLYSPELFIDSTVLEKFTNRNANNLFDDDLNDAKNLIYQNLYNNLTDIFKSKGTEQSLRNVFRCFNIGDNVMSININSNNEEFLLKNNLKLNLLKKNVLDFSNPSNVNALVYQASSSLDEMNSVDASGSIDGAEEQVPYGFTYESNIIFPDYNRHLSNLIRDKNYNQISLFGMVTVGTSTAKKEGTTTTFESAADDVCNFRVYAVRESEGSKNAYFKLTSSFPEGTFESVDGGADIAGIDLTSSVYLGVYNDEPWNFSIRLKPKNYPRSTFVVSGSDSTSAVSPVETYDVIFTGINPKTADIRDMFILSQSIPNSTAKAMITARKRLFVGADRTNLTGDVQYKSDVQASSVSYWGKYLSDNDLIQHAVDFENIGLSNSQDRISPLDANSSRNDILNRHALILNWNFRNVTGSGADGDFVVQDFSSGSSEIRDKFGWLGNISGYQYTGLGFGFKTSSADVVQKKSINTYKFINPERVVSSDMIQLFSEEDEFFPDLRREEFIPNHVYTVEKSMYNAITEEMLDFMAGVADFHSLIGNPVNRYRSRYKEMEKLREAFFRRVDAVSDVEKYIDYYKWFDDAVTSIISQLIPASAEYVENIQNVIESHVLERNRYKSRINIIESQAAAFDDTEASADSGYEKESYEDKPDSTDKPGEGSDDDEMIVIKPKSSKDKVYTPTGASKDAEKTTSKGKGTVTPDADADGGHVRKSPLDPVAAIKGGVNFPPSKNLDFSSTRLRPAGPVDTTDNVFVPLNVMIGYTAESVIPRDVPPKSRPSEYLTKDKKIFHVQQGKDWELGIGYKNVKSNMVLPFNVISSNVEVNSGYNKDVVSRVGRNLQITNLHNDAYGSMIEVPMQGPFTNYAVGGHQSRHVSINKGTDNQLNRPEAWRLRLGTCADLREGDGTANYTLDRSTPQTGAVGLVGPDYPPPEYNPPAGTVPYPYNPFQKAYLYRDGIAKRPVNIRNIKHTTGSTILGNYSHNYEVVHSFGAYNNPRAFIENQPTLPSVAFQNNTTSSTSIRTILSARRGEQNHFNFIDDYDVGYLTGTTNKSIIITRFAHRGGTEIESRGYQDFKASEYSVYNAFNNRNLSVKKPSQGPSGTLPEPHGGTPSTSRVFDIHGKDYGLNSHLARHTARFGRDSLFVTSSDDLPGASYDQLPGFHKIHRNKKQVIVATNGDNTAFATSSKHDNFNVIRQIPRSDRQYRWINNSVADINNIIYSGFQRTNLVSMMPYRTSSAGKESYWSFVSSSDASTGSIYQPANRLNIIIVDPINRLTNTIGHAAGTDVSNYTNTDLVDTKANPNYLNQLLSKRQAVYGWGWNKFHLSDNKVFIEQRKANELILTEDAKKSLKSYRLPPISMKGRQFLVNFDTQVPGGVKNLTLKATNTNEKIFFSQRELNTFAEKRLDKIKTPANDLLAISRSPGNSFNWFIYVQNVFPSMRNEFVSKTTKRLDYDNLYWRDDSSNRITVGNTVLNSFGVTVSQSSWPLDPPVDFLTRNLITVGLGDETSSLQTYNITETQAGELQNTYGSYFTINADGAKFTYNKPAALYSRKHCLGSPRSVVSPAGQQIAETGSFTGSFTTAQQIETLAGEAVWEAASQAGVIEKKAGESIFVPSASNPWWNDYDDFREDLRLKAKGYAVIPEFRMSEHINEYYKYGTINKSLRDTFEIPGTIFSSSQTDFYKDFSNTDFIESFLGIKTSKFFSAKEIRLRCNAAIRYNAYKGFYPVQRTLDLVNQFYDSFNSALQVNFVDNNGDPQAYTNKDNFLRDTAGGVTKVVFDKLFSPGILYNSIKSGLAVDYPIVTDPSTMNRTVFGTDQLDTSLHSYALTITNATSSAQDGEGYDGGLYWNKRIPFEGIIDPKKHLPGTSFLDMESHPSMSLDAFNVNGYPSETEIITGSLNENGDEIYNMMARNFFGECSSFFLKDSELSRLESSTVTDDLKFKKDEVYMARIKLRRSHNGERTYQHDVDSNNVSGSTSNYAINGAKIIDRYGVSKKQSFPIPQDPSRHPTFRETFTMYSRPSAFGPPVAGRPSGSRAVSGAFEYAAKDSFEGYNPAFTPPYYDGESWVDLVFRPTASVSYDLERILSETEVKCWRFDAGFKSPTSDGASTATFTFSDKPNETTTITLTDVAGTSVVFEVDDTGDGASGTNTAVDGAGAAGFATALHTAINASALDMTSTNPSSGKIVLTQGTAGVAGNTSITSTLTTSALSVAVPSAFTEGFDGAARASLTALIPIEKLTDNADYSGQTPENDLTIPSIYDGYRINKNSMQLTSSIDIFGIERVLEQAVDKFGNVIETKNKTVGSKWVIQTKWETPMLNFNDEGVRPITAASGTLTLPTYGAASVPRGMWHQFGTIPDDQKTGVFLEIGDIPDQWLKNHYDVLNNETIYNNFSGSAKETKNLHKRVKSLTNLCGFNKTNTSTKIGQIKDKLIVSEAIIAVPYILEEIETNARNKLSSDSVIKQQRKKFVSIPKRRFDAAMKENIGSQQGDSLSTAGESIRKLKQSMEKYVFPPEFDFLKNKSVKPVAMYVFEFDYEFDKDDLSYIWQNTAPRDYQKLEFKSSTISHNLSNNELINEEILAEENLRWMVFKVKQRSQVDYYDLISDQAGEASTKITQEQVKSKEYQFGFNWPYDYLSFVELIKMDVDVLVKKR